MVLQKQLDYSFNGYRVPTMPRATRSARRRGRIRKRVEEDNQVVAFDLLAKVAGKLLEKESPLTSRDTSTEKINSAVMKKEWQDDLSSQDLQYPSSEFVREVHNQYIQNNSSKESFHHYDGEYKIMVKDELHKTGKILNDDNGVDMFDDLDDPDDSSGKVTSCRDHIPQSSYPACRNDIKKVVSRDDDEKSSGCTHQSNSVKSFRQVPHFGDCRMRRILTSKFWKVAPKYSAETITNTDGCDLMPTDHNKSSYKRQRSQMHIPFKKRKFFHCSSISNTDGRNIDRTPDTCKKDASGIGTSSLGSGCQTSFQSRDSHVKLRIKSFKVPELFIEISETATIGSLKRTVMEAVNAILGCGLQVGVILQGKKVRDNSKTLFQTGISCDSQLESLGFSLEPNPSQTPEPLYHAHSSPFLFPSDAPELLSRCPAYPNVDNLASSNLLCVPHMGDFENVIESDHDSAPSPTNVSVEKSTTNSKALIAVDAMPMEPLSVVPAHQKSKRSEIVQRRIRRPFSVAEVEALVQAVEKLGTGRWRDVKLRAFDNAKHRTYVDLKDKWKTLVHTARISPHQRRGEPVPQELLDRVLTANAYWSQQQAKHQLKHQSESETSLLRAS